MYIYLPHVLLYLDQERTTKFSKQMLKQNFLFTQNSSITFITSFMAWICLVLLFAIILAELKISS